MRYSRIFGAVVVVSVASLAAPVYVMAQTATDKVEQKAKQGWQKTKDVTRDATGGVSDAWLTGKTKIALFADERVKGRQVSVETVNGTVTLRGKVDSDEAKGAAATVAKAIDGVKSVRNDLQVVPPGDQKVIDISDKDITRQVEGRLSKDAQLKKVDVRTDAGMVTLAGAVPSIGASAHASELAREVPGVRSVKNQLTYDAATRDRSLGTTAGSHAHVMAMQQALKDKGFDPGRIDGVVGPRTAAALTEYQKSENLTTTGKMDRDTAAKLGVKGVSAEKRQSP